MAKEILPVITSTSNPSTTDDATKGYRKGQIWVNTATPAIYYCSVPTASAAVWNTMGGSSVTDEHIMDVVGALLGDTATIDVTYNDAGDIESFAIIAGSITTTHLANNSVTLAKMATQADATMLGNVSGGVAVPVALTPTQIRALINVANGATAYTNEDAQDAIASLLVAGTGITLTYNDGANTLTITATGGGGSADPSDQNLNLGLQFLGI